MNRKTILMGIVAAAIIALGVATYLVYSNSGTPALADGGSNAQKVVLTADDHTMGDPKAPVTVIEYAAPSCPICAHWSETIFPQFKAQYIDTGKVYYVLRIFPLRSLDLAVAGMAHCLPHDAYFNFIDMMWRNQSMWDPDGYQIADEHAALLHMGTIAGMSNSQTETCISDQAVLQAASQVGQDATQKWGIDSTPSFVINGQLQPNMGSWQAVQDTLNPIIAQASK